MLQPMLQSYTVTTPAINILPALHMIHMLHRQEMLQSYVAINVATNAINVATNHMLQPMLQSNTVTAPTIN